MRKLTRIIVLCLAVLIAGFSHSAALHVYAAAEPAEIVDETWTILEDNYMDSFGWLALSADPPVGFEGILCLELSGLAGKKETIELTSMTEYIGGKWLPEGTYTVTDAYVPNSDHFLVQCNGTEVVISNSEDAALILTLQEAVDVEATLESIIESFEPDIPTMPPETIESSTEPEFIPTETPQETFPEPGSRQDGLSNYVPGLLVMLLFLGIILFVWYKKKTDIEE